MNSRIRLCLSMILTVMLVTGCWDRTELSDLAFVLGFGMDKEGDRYVATIQFANPAGLATGKSGGSTEKGNSMVESAEGYNITDATQKLQNSVSRQINPGQRRVIFIGEELAKYGFKELLDEYTRNPDVRMRSDIYVVKNGEAKDILQLDYPFERVPTLGALKIHQVLGGRGDTTLRDFLIKAADDSSSPVLPVIEAKSETSQLESEKPGEKFRFAGNSIFSKDMKMIGYLDNEEAAFRLWMANDSERKTETVQMPTQNGTITLNLRKLSCSMKPTFQSGKLTIRVMMKGTGDVIENETNLDLLQPSRVQLIQKALEQQITNRVQKLVHHAQQDYKTDVFGFGESIHRKNPVKWKQLKTNWNETFANTDVQISTVLTIQRVGLTTSALQMQDGKR